MNLPSSCAAALALVIGSAGAQGYGWQTFIPNQAYTTIIPQGVNASGLVTGVWRDTAGFDHGFLLPAVQAGAAFQSFDAPQSGGAAVMGLRGTWASGIDGAGNVVGAYSAGGVQHGFVRGASGGFTTLDIAGHRHTELTGLNDAGTMIGATSDTDILGATQAFVRGAGGTLTTIAMPGSLHTYANGIEGSGIIVGSFEDAAANLHGYLRNPAGVFQTIDVPGAETTIASGLNDPGWIVGEYDTGGVGHAYVRSPSGTVTTIDPPGSAFAVATAINAAGWIVGQSCDVQGTCRGFLATPVPEPGSWVLMAAGLGAIALASASFKEKRSRSRRRRR